MQGMRALIDDSGCVRADRCGQPSAGQCAAGPPGADVGAELERCRHPEQAGIGTATAPRRSRATGATRRRGPSGQRVWTPARLPAMQRSTSSCIGAGAAGLFCAGIAGQRGLRVLLIDHADKVAEKIRISGGGRCNFTNRDSRAGQLPVRRTRPSAARRWRATRRPTSSRWCSATASPSTRSTTASCSATTSAEQIIAHAAARMRGRRGARAGSPARCTQVRRGRRGFELDTDRGSVRAAQLVVATGGLSIPKIGATDFGYRLARQFGHRVVEPRPALVPLTFDAAAWAPFAALAGVSLEVGHRRRRGQARQRFVEDLLFTHRGLSGPAVLQISSYWRPARRSRIDLAPGRDLADALRAAKAQSRRQLGNELATVPAAAPGRRLAAPHAGWRRRADAAGARPRPGCAGREPAALAARARAAPRASARPRSPPAASTPASSSSPEPCKAGACPGLHFIGEVVDVTGWLGGYNFQWAWASAAACARGLARRGASRTAWPMRAFRARISRFFAGRASVRPCQQPASLRAFNDYDSRQRKRAVRRGPAPLQAHHREDWAC